MTHLVDTSALERLSVPAVRAVVEPLAETGQLARASICDLEVGDSTRNAREWDRLVGALDVRALVETSAAHLLRAKQIQRHLASKSQRGRKIPDLLIAAAAEAERLTVLHDDQDFDKISKITGQPCQWVVPAGSVD